MWLVRKAPSNMMMEARETRDPQAATITPLRSTWLRRNFSWNPQTAIAEGLYSNIYVFACARARAQDLSSLPLRVGADPDKPKDFDTKHPLARLLGPTPGGPTMNLSARRLLAWTSVQYDITGRFGWEIAKPERRRRDGVPFELWPLPASNLHPIQPWQASAEWFSHFEYQVGNQRTRLERDQVLYYWRPSATDFREPESLLKAAALNVSIAVMQDRYDYAFLSNDARPAAVVVHEAFTRKKERNAFRRQFLETHQGADNAGKMAFVEADPNGARPAESLFVQTLGLSQRDAEFIERYENQIRAICVAFATPLSRLADSSRRTYANAERETKNYWLDGIKPHSVELAEAINVGLMPLLNDNNNVCWFDTTGVPELEPPRRFAVGDIPELLAARVITRNEARAGIYLSPVEDGDVFEEPTQLELTTGDTSRSTPGTRQSILSAINNDCSFRANQLADKMLASVEARTTGKRGRQAIERGSSAWDVMDEAYWFDVACAEFTSWARSVAIAASAEERVPYHESRSMQWADRWGHALADHWMTRWKEAMVRTPVADVGAIQRDVSIDPVLSHTVWVSARSTASDDSVPLESVTDLILKLHSGEVSPEEALQQLG